MNLKIIALSIILTLPLVVTAQQELKTTAQLEKATVYSKGVTLEHKATLNIAKGQSEIVINNIANQVDERSIQVAVPSSVNILSLRFDNSTLDYPQAHDAAADLLMLRNAEAELTKVSNQELAERNTLGLIEDYGKSLSSAHKDIKVEELEKLASYYKKQQLELRNNLAAIALQKEKLTSEIQVLKIKAGLINNSTKGTGRIILKLMSTQPINSSISFSYFSPNAAWTPSYDFKVKDINSPLNIVHKADITQTTGLDWKKTQLSLSTGNPTVGNTAPELKTWMLSFGNFNDAYTQSVTSVGAALDGAAPGLLVTSGGGQPGSSPDIMLRGQGSLSAANAPLIVLDGAPYPGDLNTINPADVKNITVLKDATSKSVYGARAANGVILVSTKKNKNTGINDFTHQEEHIAFATFDISIPYDIPSDGLSQTVAINDVNQKVSYEYLAIPKLDSDAFLMANLTHFDALNLQKGVANIIYENNYMGQSYINPFLAQDTLSLSLGRDKKIITKRNKIEDKTSSKFIGNSRKRTFTYEITVKNVKSQPVNLVVKENIPIATDNSMVVELTEHSQAQYDAENGMLEWKLQLQPGETKIIRLSYNVKYPNGKWIANL